MNRLNKTQLKLYFICGTNDADEPLTVIEEALKSGVTIFQLREKGESALTGGSLEQFALQVKDICHKYDVPFIINDDVDLAIKVNADGIHLGQDDIKPSELPSECNNKIVGLSIGNLTELNQSDLSRVDYIGTGPVFGTQSKSDAGEAIQPSGLYKMRQHIGDMPMVAIGGINHTNYLECIENGADGIAIISAISKSHDVSSAVKQFLDH